MMGHVSLTKRSIALIRSGPGRYIEGIRGEALIWCSEHLREMLTVQYVDEACRGMMVNISTRGATICILWNDLERDVTMRL
jgi:hypothetical protein